MTNLVCRLFDMILSLHLLPPPKCTTATSLSPLPPPTTRSKTDNNFEIVAHKIKTHPLSIPQEMPSENFRCTENKFTALVIYRNIEKFTPTKNIYL